MLIALAAGWPLILLGRIISWFGKGLRGPLRDAIVIQAVHPHTRGRAFGFHRATDTIGAVLGPLLGVALLGYVAYRWGRSREPARTTARRILDERLARGEIDADDYRRALARVLDRIEAL